MPLEVDGDNGEFGFRHRPVLLREVLEALGPRSGGVYVDCTLGGAGHGLEILKASTPGGRLVGLDRDGDAIRAASARLAEFGDRVSLVRSNFSELPGVLEQLGIEKVDGILCDLGVSSYQLDNPERGFSYMHDAPLDMRMDRRSGTSAAEMVNTLPVKELERIIREYGEEKFAGRIASFIAREREKAPIETTGRLVEIIKSAIPAGSRREGPHPAKRTFQAIRIAVNRELDVLRDAIPEMVDCLRDGGRICIITFHSLEDRIVKESFRELARGCVCPADFPVCVCGRKPLVRVIGSRGVAPSEVEVEENPRARSARLRVAEKVHG
ncbi:MAG: 16S rRNA (cytosine(1402)-N(4))-methyltransferase RsmH [Bacillota bacterium]